MLSIHDLHLRFGQHHVLRGVTMSVQAGQVVGLVGASGSGKSALSLAIMGLLPDTAQITGTIAFDPSLLHRDGFQTHRDGAAPQSNSTPQPLNSSTPLNPTKLPKPSKLPKPAIVFQEPATALNPLMRCGEQIAEVLRLHRGMTAKEARQEALRWLEKVQLTDNHRIAKAYPHQISGGQRQRVMIAQAIAGEPKLLIADEPTTALDADTERGILDLLLQLRDDMGLGILIISHDLDLIASVADHLVVLEHGQIIAEGAPDEVRKLLSRPTLQVEKPELGPELVSVSDIHIQYPVLNNWRGVPVLWQIVVSGLDIAIRKGELVGLVGASGSGKTSVAKWVLEHFNEQLQPHHDVPLRRKGAVYIAQDPAAALNPRMTVAQAIGEPLRVLGFTKNAAKTHEKTLELLQSVGLSADHLDRLPSQLSGGQRQRVCIARALAVEPQVLICDEITSALDADVQATVIQLLLDLRMARGLGMLFISHNRRLVEQICDRVIVL
jgi:peptide/nickel transport system ATP-binding protein